MRSTFGVFREVYKGDGIYWQDCRYNVEGSGDYRSVRDAKAAIDAHAVARETAASAELREKVSSGRYLVAQRNPDDSVTVATPDGPATFRTIRAARQNVFELEDRFNLELIWR